MRTFIINWVFLLATPGWANPPEQLPALPLNHQGAVEFPAIAGGGRAPIAATVMANGVRVPHTDPSAFFGEKLWAYLPPQARIQIKSSTRNQPLWDYPVGTALFHEIRLHARSGTLPFELRMVRKEADASWSFTTYVPAPQGWQALDSEQTMLPQESLTYEHPSQGQVHLDWRRIHPRNCRNCHSMRVDQEQFPTLDSVGPCGFTPLNPALTASWAKEFEKLRGHSPFSSN